MCFSTTPSSTAVGVADMSLNPTRTVTRLPYFPSLDFKVEILSVQRKKESLIGDSDLMKAIPRVHGKFKHPFRVASLGHSGVPDWNGRSFLSGPEFKVEVIDTPGAGDIFHGVFLYDLPQKWIHQIPELPRATVLLNCIVGGASGNISTPKAFHQHLHLCGRSEPAFAANQLLEATGTVREHSGWNSNQAPSDSHEGNLA